MMKYPEFKFSDTAVDGPHHRNNVIEVKEMTLPDPPIDCYATYFRFPEDYVKHFEANDKSVNGYRGVCFSDFIPIDIDRKDPAESLKVVKDFLQWLDCAFDIPLESIAVFYSGWKGFHIYLPISLLGEIKPSDDLPKRFRNFVKSFGDWGFDLTIYNENRLLRMENTIHSETGFYKVRLTVSEIFYLTCTDIRRIATATRDSNDFPDYYDWNSVTGRVELWEKTKTASKESSVFGSDDRTLNFPGVKEGQRNNTSFKIARALKAKGFTVNEAKEFIVSEWNPKNNPPETDIASLHRTVESAFRYNISDWGSIGLSKHLRNDPYFNAFNNDEKAVYIYLITHVNETDNIVWQKYECKPSEMIFSYRSLAANAGVSERKVRTFIKKLKNLGRITVETLSSESGKIECSKLLFHCFQSDTLSDTQISVEKT